MYAYLKRCGIKYDRVLTTIAASRLVAGGNVTWVLDKFPEELRAVRSRQTKAETLLIVMLDADKGTVEDRQIELAGRVKRAE